MQHDGRKAAELMIESVNDKTVRKCFDIYHHYAFSGVLSKYSKLYILPFSAVKR